MRMSPLSIAFLALLAQPASALMVEDVSDTELRRYTATLAEHAGSSQWQQLWRNSREQGRFSTSGPQPRFTLPMREIPAMVRQTLAEPDQVLMRPPSGTYLRRDFRPRATGQAHGRGMTAICVLLDWRGAPERINQGPLKADDLFHVGLAKAEPC